MNQQSSGFSYYNNSPFWSVPTDKKKYCIFGDYTHPYNLVGKQKFLNALPRYLKLDSGLTISPNPILYSAFNPRSAVVLTINSDANVNLVKETPPFDSNLCNQLKKFKEQYPDVLIISTSDNADRYYDRCGNNVVAPVRNYKYGTLYKADTWSVGYDQKNE